MTHEIPADVIAAFPLGKVSEIANISHGLIHQTYQITTEKGMFVLQRLHPVLAAAEIAEDFLAVTSFLCASNFPAPHCILSRAGSVLVQDEQGKSWRLQTFLAGHTVHRIDDTSSAKESGHLYARFHRVMSTFPHALKTKRIGHDTPALFASFKETSSAFADDALMDGVEDDVRLIVEELPALFLPDHLPLRIIHGDPKVSNILFDAAGKATALVDLDTCNHRPLAVELGDAFRSWCGLEEDRADNHFRLDIFEAAWHGYRAAADFLTSEEIVVTGQGIGLITLELASRFLADYFIDSYFGWDAKRYPSRRAHNLARVRGQIAFYKDFVSKQGEIKRILCA